MKVFILSVTVCQPTQKIIRYFENKEIKIDGVIIENTFRKKYSKSEMTFRSVHDKFNRITKKYSFIRRVARLGWDMLPLFLRKIVLTKIYYIPLLNRFSLRKFCEKRKIKVFEVNRHSSQETLKIINDQNIDYLLMVASNWLLKEPIISIPSCKIINAHSGWLPKHKGLDSIAWSLVEGDKVGLTTHFIDAGIDSGDIIKFYEAKINSGDNFNTICNKVGSLQASAFLDTLEMLEENKIVPKPQNSEYSPHSPMQLHELLELEKKLTNKN